MNYFSFLTVFVVIFLHLASIGVQARQCAKGLNLTYLRGTETSKDFPYDVGSTVICTWTLKNSTATLSDYVYIIVQTLGLANGDNFTVTELGTPLNFPEPLEAPFAFAVLTNGSVIDLKTGIQTDKNNPRRISFDWYTNDFPISLNAPQGVIESPTYSAKNGSELSLTWIVSGKVGRTIGLSFKKFNISDGVLNITDANGSIQTFNGSEVPSDILVPTPNVKLDLLLPITDPNLGFQLFYKEVIQNCSSEVTVNGTAIVSLNVTASESRGTCVWLLKGANNTILSATLSSIESSANSSDGHLSFHDGGAVSSKSLGLFVTSLLVKDTTLLTTQNRLWIAYTYPDSSVPNITLTVSVLNNGATLHGSGSLGVSPSTANKTLESNTSMWSLVAENNKRVRVDIVSLSVNGSGRIVLHDGNCIDNANVLMVFDENSTKIIPVVSSESEMFVVAENLSANATFNATFTSVSKSDFVLSSTSFGNQQLAKLDSKSNFTWFIKPIVNKTTDVISLIFNALAVNGSVSSFVIYEGLATTGPLLANVTNSTTDLAIFINAAKGAMIVYDNFGPNVAVGRLLDAYYLVLPICASNVNVTKEIVLKSPSYPRSYPINTDCTFMLTAPPNKTLLLSFEEVDLAKDHIVAVFSGNVSVMNLTGTNAPDDYISNGSSLVVKFLARSLPTNLTAGRGYSIRVVPLDCGGHLTDEKNTMTTPKYPDVLNNSTVCVWSIELPKAKDVEIVSLDIESKAVASSPASLSFIDGGTLHSMSSDVVNSSATSYLSRTGKLMIVYNYTQDLKVNGSAFKFNYAPHVCSATQLCKNGICMHDNWKCNGINECGDFTDEYNCTSSPTVVESSGVGVATFVLMIFLMFFTGVAVALAAPHLWRRVRSPRHYQSFGGPVDA